MKKETEEFLKIAEEDLKEAKKALDSGLIRSACFWTQQAIELYLKAFLIEKGIFDISRHRTHNLLFLAKECCKVDEDFEEIVRIKKLELLSKLAVGLRYDITLLESLNEEDAKEAIEIAERVRGFVLGKLKLENYKG